MSRFCSIDPVGILNACTTQVRTNSARITAMTIDSKYSRAVDFLKVVIGCSLARGAPPFGFAQGALSRSKGTPTRQHALRATAFRLRQGFGGPP